MSLAAYVKEAHADTEQISLVSVIVPIFNVENYLAQCLDSICAQTYEHLEILCINDGSTDGSQDILARYAARDPRIRLISKTNAGYGAACNTGLSLAQGEWISVVEPDDWIEQTMYERLLAAASAAEVPGRGKVDVVKASFYEVGRWDDPKRQTRQAFLPFARIEAPVSPSGKPLAFTIDRCTTLIKYHPSIWSALYRREFLNHWCIRFPEIPGAGWADNPFMIETMCRASSIVYVQAPLYNYRADLPGSTKNHSSEAAIRRPFDRWLDMEALIRKIGIDKRSIIEALYYRAFTYVYGAIYDDGWDNPVVQSGTREIFSNMDPEIVAAQRDVQPKRKRFFFKTRGLGVPRINPFPWLRYALDNTLCDLAKGGLRHRLQDTYELIFGRR